MGKKRFAFANANPVVRIPVIFLMTIASLGLMGAILFLAAGTVKWLQGWVFLILFGALSLITGIIAVIKDPEMVDLRTQKQIGAQKWDRRIINVLGVNLFLILIVAGFDAVRFKITSIPLMVSFIAVPFTGVYIVVQLWAGLVNKHFEGNVRIQNDRNHQVISRGPYKIVRHLFYATFILFWIAAPLALGSILAFIPGAIGVVALIYRTAREDRFLLAELEGYQEYAKKTRYRLFPGIW